MQYFSIFVILIRISCQDLIMNDLKIFLLLVIENIILLVT